MTALFRARGVGIAVVAAAIALPLGGAGAAGRDLRPLFQFPPPLTIPVGYPRFSWIAFVLVIAPFAALAGAWWRARKNRGIWPLPQSEPSRAPQRAFPAWGWLALVWTLAWWGLAWTRFNRFTPIQQYTFLPLCLGFIVTVNALTTRRIGGSWMLRAPRQWCGLFVVSAVFWWVFEWLNRFSNNWHYFGVRDFGPVAYAVNATLCFSTVLPAVAGVVEWLGTFPRFQAGCAAGPRLPWFAHPSTAIVLLIGGALGLIGTGVAPWKYYAALWAAPLALVLADEIRQRQGLPMDVAKGDWRRVASWAVAALVCGTFWELWNVASAAKWIYTVPYADRWHVFEMPLLGYVGYLPFGLECYFVTTRVLGDDALSRASST